MRVVTVGSDRNLFVPGSSARERIASYGQLFDQLHVIVFTRRRSRYGTEQIAPNVTVYPTSSHSRLTYVRDAVRVALRLTDSGRAGDATVVSAQDPFEAGLAAYRIAKSLGAKLHLQLHTDLTSPHFRATALNWLRLLMARFLLPRADAVRVVSEQLRSSLVARYGVRPERMTVLPIFVDPSSFSPADSSGAASGLRALFPDLSFIALAACRLTAEKRLDVAIEAAAEATRRHAGLGLVVAGEGPLRAELARLVERLGASGRIKLLPWQPQLADLYRSADAFVQTSAFEGYGMSVIEAALSGLAVISTRVGVAAELVQAGAALGCDVGDTGAVANALVLLADNPERRRQLAAEGRRWALGHLPDRATYLQRYRQSLEAALS